MCEFFVKQNPNNFELETRRLRLNKQSTSIRLEKLFWQIIDDIAKKEKIQTTALISKLQSEVIFEHGEARNFTSMLRCVCLIHLNNNLSGKNIQKQCA